MMNNNRLRKQTEKEGFEYKCKNILKKYSWGKDLKSTIIDFIWNNQEEILDLINNKSIELPFYINQEVYVVSGGDYTREEVSYRCLEDIYRNVQPEYKSIWHPYYPRKTKFSMWLYENEKYIFATYEEAENKAKELNVEHERR